VRDRLLFIRRVREAEAEGEIRPVSLSSLRELFGALPRGLVASVSAGETPITPDIVSLSAIEQRSMVDRVAALRKRLLDARPGPPAKHSLTRVHEDERLELRAPAPPDFDEEPDEDADTVGEQLSWVLNELRAQVSRRRAGAPSDLVDTWSQVEVTSDIRLSVRGMADEDAFLLRVAGRLLRQVLESLNPLVEESSDELEE
jgi:hypothetical protein